MQNSSYISSSQNEQNIEIEKWKKFGYLVAESYDDLKGEHERVKLEKDKDKKIIIALKD